MSTTEIVLLIVLAGLLILLLGNIAFQVAAGKKSTNRHLHRVRRSAPALYRTR